MLESDWKRIFDGIRAKYSKLEHGSQSALESFVSHVKSLENWEDWDMNFPDPPVEFPDKIWIAFAVCHPDCGVEEFIVDGSTQECQRCGRHLFRNSKKIYCKVEKI
jgi:hypothetical protein